MKGKQIKLDKGIKAKKLVKIIEDEFLPNDILIADTYVIIKKVN